MNDKYGRTMNANDPAIYTSPTRTYFVRTIGYPTPGGDYSVCLSSNTIENIDPTKRPQIMAALDSEAEDALVAARRSGTRSIHSGRFGLGIHWRSAAHLTPIGSYGAARPSSEFKLKNEHRPSCIILLLADLMRSEATSDANGCIVRRQHLDGRDSRAEVRCGVGQR